MDDVGEVGVDERRSFCGQGAGEVGDAADPPDLDLAVQQALPDLGESVTGFDGVGEQHPARVGRATQGGGELDDRELRNLRCTGAGELEHRVGTGHPEPGQPGVLCFGVGVVVGQPECAVQVGEQLAGGVALSPLGDRDEPVPVGLVSSLVEVANLGQQVTGRHRSGVLCRVILVPECHDQILLEHQFERNPGCGPGEESVEDESSATQASTPADRKGQANLNQVPKSNAHRKHAFDKCRTCCSANAQAPTHPDHRVDADRRACRERGSRGTLQSPRRAGCLSAYGASRLVAGAPRTSTGGGGRRSAPPRPAVGAGSRDGAGAPPRPAVTISRRRPGRRPGWRRSPPTASRASLR